LQEWLDSDEGKKASDDAKLQMATRIGDLYRINSRKTLLSTPVPLFLAGTRTEPDIAATVKKIEAEKQAGRLTETQYKQEMIRIRRMADILAAQAEEESRSRKGSGR
jgi:hypothetical protein